MLTWFLKKKKHLFLYGISVLLLSCSDENSGMEKVDFDRTAMLTHWYDDQIIPSFTAFDTRINQLRLANETFISSPDTASLMQLKNAFQEAYLHFQHIKFYSFGPSANTSLRASFNTYPADTAKIENFVSSVTFNGGAANQLTAQGFPAIDYLLFSAQNQILSSSKHRDYVSINIAYMVDLSNSVFNAWKVERTAFIKANGTDVSSSLGQMVNSINQDYELIKNAKIGFPAGKKTFGTTYPKAVEAYYSGISLALAKENIKAIHNLYKGYNPFSKKQGLSLLDNLLATKAQSEDDFLAEVIDKQFETAENSLAAISLPLSDALNQESNLVDAAYSAIQLNIIYLKTDMPSALGVIITYQDNDGD